VQHRSDIIPPARRATYPKLVYLFTSVDSLRICPSFHGKSDLCVPSLLPAALCEILGLYRRVRGSLSGLTYLIG
jgi:hypothetical protein